MQFVILTVIFTGLVASQQTTDSELSGFGTELLLTKIEQLEAKVQEQTVQSQQIAQLEARLISSLEEQTKSQQRILELQQLLAQSIAQQNAVKQTVAQLALQQRLAESKYAGLVGNNEVYLSCKNAPSVTGIYRIRAGAGTVQGYCEQHDHDGGWLVVQRHVTGNENFNRSWSDYRNGFGTLDGDFWLGLEQMHLLTRNQDHELLVEVTEYTFDRFRWLKYGSFQLGSEMVGYRITKLGNTIGGTGSSMFFSDNEPFNTFDKINGEGCPEARLNGGWWYGHFCRGNLNGIIGSTEDESTMHWGLLKVKASRMMIRTKANI